MKQINERLNESLNNLYDSGKPLTESTEIKNLRESDIHDQVQGYDMSETITALKEISIWLEEYSTMCPEKEDEDEFVKFSKTANSLADEINYFYFGRTTENENLNESSEATEQWKKVTEILGDKLNDENHSGGLYYVDATADEVSRLASEAPAFLDPSNYSNERPTQGMFIEFLKNNKQFEAECYVIDPAERSDYRIEVTGIKAENSEENKSIIEQFVSECMEKDSRVNSPDEFDEYDGKIRAWWD